jgi:AcrR family transcriptional regulator
VISEVGTADPNVQAGLPCAIGGLPEQDRILWSMVRAVAEEGFESVSVTDVVRRADVPRAAFYEVYECERECLLAAYEKVIDALVAYVGRAFEGDGPWPLKMRRALGACLEACSAEPEVARMTTVEVPATEPEAQRRYRGALTRFRPLFSEGRKYAGPEILPPDLELMSIGGVEAIIHDEVAAGRTKGLPALLPEILFTVLVPYVGPDVAAAEVRGTGES